MSVRQIQRIMEEGGCEKIRHSGDGSNLVSTCPFHEGSVGHSGRKHNPSFAMHIETGVYVCYSGNCGATGTLIDFMMDTIGYDFQRAAKLANSIVTTVGEDEEDEDLFPDWENRHDKKSNRRVLKDSILGLYSFVPKYMLRRGFSRTTLKRWEIGYDIHRKQVTIPVRDIDNKLIGISRRQRDGVLPKYLHLGFPKSQTIYGAFKKGEVKTAWVGEGQLDAVGLDVMLRSVRALRGDLGVPVSPMGSKVSKRQVELLAENFDRVMLALDDDAAGKAARDYIGNNLTDRWMDPKRIMTVSNWRGWHDPAQIVEEGSYKDYLLLIDSMRPWVDVTYGER